MNFAPGTLGLQICISHKASEGIPSFIFRLQNKYLNPTLSPSRFIFRPIFTSEVLISTSPVFWTTGINNFPCFHEAFVKWIACKGTGFPCFHKRLACTIVQDCCLTTSIRTYLACWLVSRGTPPVTGPSHKRLICTVVQNYSLMLLACTIVQDYSLTTLISTDLASRLVSRGTPPGVGRKLAELQRYCSITYEGFYKLIIYLRLCHDPLWLWGCDSIAHGALYADDLSLYAKEHPHAPRKLLRQNFSTYLSSCD